VTAGLLNYPLLMAADILLYGATVVPVGEDQRQHIELAREIAQRFNALYGEVFTEPRALVPARAARIRNLLDPRRKMDKSDPDPRTWVSLLDPPDAVRQKIARAKTDSLGTFPIDREDEGIANLVTICSELGGGTRESIAERYGSRGYAALKADLAERLNQLLAPIQSRHREIIQDPAGMARLMAVGRDRAMARAARAMARIRSAVGLAQP
jgi:tryptophanyl-tRNA synthetase